MATGKTLPDFDALWDYDQPAKTEAAFRALLPQAEASGDSSYLIELLTQIARAQGLQRDFAAAHQTLDQALALLTDDLKRARVRYLLERGRVFNSSGKPDEARPLFLAAWEEGPAAQEDFHTIDAAHMLAIVAPPDEQFGWNLKALALVEQTGDARAHKWGGSLYNNIGWSYHERGEYQQALEAFQKALEWRQAYSSERPEPKGDISPILIARWSVARTLRSLGRLEEALSMQQALLEDWKPLGGSAGYPEEEAGECLLALGRAEEARPYFAQAYAKLSQDAWLAAEEPARLARLKQLGEESTTQQ